MTGRQPALFDDEGAGEDAAADVPPRPPGGTARTGPGRRSVGRGRADATDAGARGRSATAAAVAPARVDDALHALAAALHARFGDRLYLGTSSWHFPGWAGQVWDRAHAAATLSRHGLAAYAAHPLLRTVSLDRAFYRALDAATAAGLAAQARATAPDFRFVVKAPAALTDALQRDPATGAARGANPQFLDSALAADTVAALAAGMGDALGVLVLQLSPLPPSALDDLPRLLDRLGRCTAAIAPQLPPGALLGLEVRDAALLHPAVAAHLHATGLRYVLGLHDRLPAIDDQLPMLRATWPGDLVCRWNLQRGQRYAQARDRWAPFDRLQSPDLATRTTLARVMKATLEAGHRVFVTINNKAEGSAPASVRALAQALLVA